MILGFGNNVVSSLASDITASQTTFSVIPGDGPLFASLLTSDFSNRSTTLKNYAKITLTDSGETAFEVCHLTAVSGDTLTVIRGQEGTAAKGWALKDVVANFATRGSENAFPQIAHIQSGFYTSGTAGGTANALTLELPTTFFLNGSADWVLKTPIVVYPSQNNTGAATLQLTMGGRVLGTFPLYKGNKAALVANDILKDVALVCLLDNTKTFFNVANPGAIYAGLGTAAFANLVTSKTDFTAGRVLTTGWMTLGGYGTDNLIAAADAQKPLRNGFYAVQSEPTYGNASLISFGYDTGYQVHIIAKQGGQAPLLGVCGSTPQGAFGNWGKIYTEFQKPTAVDVGALPTTGGTLTGLLTLSNATPYIALRATGSDTRRYIMGFNSDGSSSFYVGKANANSESCMLWNYTPGSGIEITADGRIIVNSKGKSSAFNTDGTFSPNSWTNFDARYVLTDGATFAGFASGDATRPYMRHKASGAVVELARKGDSYTKTESENRYQPKGSYTPAGQAYTKAESDARYQTKGNYISAMRLGSQAGANNNNSGWAMAPGGAVLTGSYQDANYTAVYYRYPQYQLNGSATWYNTGAA
ncbi:phage tail protein [Enterobacter cloacae]|uniref:phage tail protein n=1 Tax=Enterobacter cloacae TaxID=550 RepID=UPI0034A308B6